jgi:mannose-6-phosphate isomerase-like protein (cupin superfamily)
MTKTMMGFLAIAAAISSQSGATARAQAPAPPAQLYIPGINYKLPAVLVTAADIARTRQQMDEKKQDDIPMRMVDCGGGESGHQVGLSLVSRRKGQSNAGAVHDLVSEVYHVLEGAGTMILGGTLTNPKRRPVSAGNGPGISGDGIDGGVRMRIAKGDVLIIPAGTPHRFESTEEFTLYTVVRVDAEKVTPLQ